MSVVWLFLVLMVCLLIVVNVYLVWVLVWVGKFCSRDGVVWLFG